ncbi:MAG TPA: 50S ribosomal protein L9 [Candidatus Hydrogenedentes bacterium]|nr:50S ribosomal protein L9 [Candidatus Hydrogenedentota bacterium]HQH66968.1 50S ribosomal protein L9 [Candidatus Hydrogenedentota bacterium]
MKVILSENVAHLGDMGATVNVSDGYARNYLFPRKLAVPADSGSAKEMEHQRRIIARREEKVRAELGQEAKALEGQTVEIKARAGENEKIFGSVTSAMIAQKLLELGYKFDRKQIELDEPIKSLGIYTVPVRLMKGIMANIKVWVSAEEPEASAQAEAVEAIPAEAAAADAAESQKETAESASSEE